MSTVPCWNGPRMGGAERIRTSDLGFRNSAPPAHGRPLLSAVCYFSGVNALSCPSLDVRGCLGSGQCWGQACDEEGTCTIRARPFVHRLLCSSAWFASLSSGVSTGIMVTKFYQFRGPPTRWPNRPLLPAAETLPQPLVIHWWKASYTTKPMPL